MLCRFASDRSAPEKIRRWIMYLEEMQQKHRHDPDAQRTLESALSRAREWLMLR